MPVAITIKAAGDTAKPLTELWRVFAQFEVTPSMAALNYPPHITLAVYDSMAEERLRDAAASCFRDTPSQRLGFNRLAYFAEPDFVVWASPIFSEALHRLHDEIHQAIDPALCHPHFHPGQWVPHATLATQITAANRDKAIELASRPIDPFEVVFDWADCVSFPPVWIIEERQLPLSPASSQPGGA